MTPIAAKRAHRRVDAAPAQHVGASFSRLLGETWRFVAMACLALALITGIVAMHSLVSPSSHSESAMAATMSMGSATVEEATLITSTLTAVDCSGCGDDASMVLMWCVLALLTVSLLFAAPRLVPGWGQYVEQRLIPAARFTWRARTAPPRPDLDSLCISRT
ncbi:DUF6153 family protein [Rhodoglobus sp.]